MEIQKKSSYHYTSRRCKGIWYWGTLFFLGWYFFEVALHYFLQRPLYNDELCVLYCIEHLSKQDFFNHALFKDQAFPRFYLYLIGVLSGFYHYSVLSLRFFPLVSMLAAFFVWASIARRELKEKGFFFFILSWAASGMLVYYAAELKQYSFDVLVAGIFFLFLQRLRDLPFWKVAFISCLLPLLGAFSYPAFFFLIFVLWNLFSLGIKDVRFRLVLGAYMFICAIMVGLVYYFDLRFTDKSLIGLFPQYFVSVKSIGIFLQTLTEGVNNLIARWFVVKPLWLRYITRFFMTFGMIELAIGFKGKFKEDGCGFYSIGAVAPILLLEMICFSIFRIFPFRLTRAVLFFCPILFFLTIQFFMRLEKRWEGASFFLQSAYACFLLFSAGLIMWIALHGNLALNLTVLPRYASF